MPIAPPTFKPFSNPVKQDRPTASKRGYDSKWQKFRLNWLNANPLCVECMKLGYVMPANIVDHIQAHRGNQELFWQTGNHQSLCKQCHDTKTAKGM